MGSKIFDFNVEAAATEKIQRKDDDNDGDGWGDDDNDNDDDDDDDDDAHEGTRNHNTQEFM